MAIILHEKFADGSSWAVWKIEESLDQLVALSMYPERMQQAAAGMMLDKRKIEFIISRLLLQSLTGEFIEVEYLPSGKPYPAKKDFRISLSHTEGYVAAMIHPDYDPGIDIEYISPRVLRVDSRFLSSREKAAIPPEDQLIQTLVLWSAKESVFKSLGQEGVEFNSQLNSDSFKLSDSGSFLIRESRTDDRIVFPIQYLVRDNFVLTTTVRMK